LSFLRQHDVTRLPCLALARARCACHAPRAG
jgi:hypothetical protein